MFEKNNKLPLLAVLLTFLIKTVFLLTHHIQEDAFITWRVAQNLLDYGVIGFNGDVKISSSTTHLYVFVSYLFNLIFGEEDFIYPILLFNSILFTFGSYFLSKLLLKENWQQAIFIILFGLLPPAIKVSILGMEYGILFFFEMALLYYGFQNNKKWALIVFPILILWTRLDTVIFLGIVFLVDVTKNKKLNWFYIVGGVLGVISLMSFNWFYFNEIVNNTIIAKKSSYEGLGNFQKDVDIFIRRLGNYWGIIKTPGFFNPITYIILVFEIYCFIKLIKQKQSRDFFLWIIFVFAWCKQLIFLSQKSLFDWYYWVPQLLLFSVILIYILDRRTKISLYFYILFFAIPAILYQSIHSIATGNVEWNYRRGIGLFLDKHEKDKNQWILLEPAGFIPYYSKLKTIDEVGLVDKEIQNEISKDRGNYWANTVKHRKPKYLLPYQDIMNSKDSLYYRENYKLIKEFKVEEHLKSENKILEKIYHLKPSGRNYYLYERVTK